MPHDLPLVPASAAGSSLTFEQDHGAVIRRSILPGGVRVFTEHIPGLRSATFGAWIGRGSRDETPEHAGSTHFLEHLLFKGTPTRGALDIAEAFDRVGGESNAMTAKEYTCYYARIIDVDLPMAVEVILDMVTGAKLTQADFDLERGVILEELAMADDDPADVAHDRFAEAVLGRHPLGRPIGGTPDIIRAVDREAVLEHYREHYRPEGLIVTAAGGVDHDALCEWVLEALDRGGWDTTGDVVPLGKRDASAPVEATLTPRLTIVRDIEQAHIVLGNRGLAVADERRNVLAVMSTILGSGMSSRLFQEIREKRGLAYTVYSFGQPHAETGLFGMYAACSPAKADEVAGLLIHELERMAEGITPGELERAQGQIAGATVLRLEDSYSRMSRLGKAELAFGELWSIGESLEQVRAVTADDVSRLAAELASRPRGEVRVGPAS
ncbi:insulinase family protein [Demequina sp. TTPB684]|uniref:M16 family metallopeptidase n=1 Tax=unclassified Demequina TaxID=2620311 RepID=UPI001CF55E6E|nr:MULTISPECIES: pitrilysin family protein [unclassified Demequina]MCB2413707.1 insulinase family protein [Demequina sp. TTPB684]UPU89620.1 insulinase family protein [Demequina sp. TMPB413]